MSALTRRRRPHGKRIQSGPPQSTSFHTLHSEKALDREFNGELFGRLTNQVPVGIFLTNTKGDCQFVNECWCRLAGMTFDQAKGQGWTDALHPDDKERVFKEWYAAAKRKRDFVSVYRFQTREGKISWLSGNAKPLYDQKGDVSGYLGSITDITEQKQTEERQKFLEEISSKLVSPFDNYVTLQDIGKLIVSNLSDYCRIAVLDKGNQIKEVAVNHTDPEKVSLAEDLYENYKNRPESTHGVQRILTSGRSELIEKVDEKLLATVKENRKLVNAIKQIGLKSYMGVPLIARGKIIGAMTLSSVENDRYYSKKDLRFAEDIAHRIALALDNVRLFQDAQAEIKERKQAELNLKYLEEASKILSSSLDYKMTLSNIAKAAVPNIADWCAVDLLDDEGKLEQVTVAHKDPKKVKWAKELRKLEPTDMNSQTGVPKVIRTGKSEYYPEITDETLIKLAKNKKQLKLLREIGFTSAIIVPLCREGQCVGGITFVTTETKRNYTQSDLTMAEELTNRASIALENAGLYKASQEAVTLRDNFISVASHELKTPITSVKIFTEVLQKHSEQIGDQMAVSHLMKMNKQLDKLTELIYNMLNISKIEAGRLEFNQKLFDLDSTVTEIVDVLQQGSPKQKLIIKGKTNKKVYGDEDRIGQVLSNLISNAIKYSPKADRVILHLSSTPENAIVCVEDFGIGVAKEHGEHIFERFYRVFDETDKTFPGLGIGLYISSEIIKRHHGKLWVESDAGKGSKFYFSLPLHRKGKPRGVQVL